MKPEVRDFAIREIGCIACIQQGYGPSPCERHHLNEGDQPGRKRRGDKESIGLCQWHHVGRCWCNGFPINRDCPKCKAERGPSWRHHKVEFTETYGDGDAMLAYQEELLCNWLRGTIGWAA